MTQQASSGPPTEAEDQSSVVVVIIRNPSGDYFVHRRRPGRRIYPGRYGIGAGGKMAPGEFADVAAARELREETGLRAALTHLFSTRYADDVVRHVMHVYQLVSDEIDLPRSNAEWTNAVWLPERAVDSMLARDMLSPDTAHIYRLYRSHGDGDGPASG